MHPMTDLASLMALLRSHHATIGRLHRHYTGQMVEELVDLGISPVDESTSEYGAAVRAAAIWLTEEGPERVEWHETDGWAIYDTPTAGAVVRAPLDIVADSRAVAEWIADVLDGRPRPGPPAEVRPAADAGPDVGFENQLATYLQAGEEKPTLVQPPAQPRSGMAWDGPLRLRCLTCAPAANRRQWTRQAAATTAAVAMSGRTATAYTGWCTTCVPDTLHARWALLQQLDRKLINAHERGRLTGSLLLSSIRDKIVCTVCFEPWWLFPGASLPSAHGRLERIGLNLHPCPWCWATDEEAARRDHERALSDLW